MSTLPTNEPVINNTTAQSSLGNVYGGILDFITKTASAVGSTYTSLKDAFDGDKIRNSESVANQTSLAPAQNDNTKTYLIIGGVILAVILLIVMMRGK